MESLLFLILAAGTMTLWSLKNNSSTLARTLGHHFPKVQKLPQAMGLMIVCAQISELLKVIEHVSLVNVVAALFLLAIAAAAKSGTEGELH
ncbi:MAG: hypothetical protein HY918_03250 [Candidatus Doudnabacteria bacterium]|nr:hypothetical protein [Candidatus Doudnabacteria bacterium]